MKKLRSHFFSQGFSLTELAIVLVIIGLLIGAITGGQHLLNRASQQQLVKQIRQYHQAVMLFNDKYQALPGDYHLASRHWNNISNGNNDGMITPFSRESFLLWQHLSKAKLIDGAFQDAQTTGLKIIPEVNVPLADDGSGVFMVYHQQSPIYQRKGLILTLLGVNSFVGDMTGALAPEQAYQLDQKLDYAKNLIASNGDIVGINASRTGNCVELEMHQGEQTALYQVSNTEPDCQLVMWFNRL